MLYVSCKGSGYLEDKTGERAFHCVYSSSGCLLALFGVPGHVEASSDLNLQLSFAFFLCVSMFRCLLSMRTPVIRALPDDFILT